MKFSDLRLNMSPESQLRSRAMTEKLLREMPLHKLKQARRLTQQMLAQVLDVQQPSITELEKCTDIYLSRLRVHVQAMGGELEIFARFPNGTVIINSFSDLEIGVGSDKSKQN